MDVIDNVPKDYPYDILNDRLLETHTLDGRAWYKAEPLDGRKPSQLLAAAVGLLLSSLLKRQAWKDHFYEYTAPFHGANSLQSIHKGFPMVKWMPKDYL